MPSRSKRVNPRRVHGHRRTELRKRVACARMPCHLCGYEIDYEAQFTDPRAYVLDELLPVSAGGSPYDRGNVAPAHRCCNSWRSDKPLSTKLRMDIRKRYERTFMLGGCDRRVARKTSRNWLD